MSAAKAVLIGGVLFGVGAWFLHSRTANAASGTAAAPPPVPPGATVDTFAPPIAGTGMALLKRSSWHVPSDASGQQAGTFVLTQNAANLSDWVLAFKGDAGGGGIVSYSQTPNGGLLAQAATAGQ